MRNPALGLLVLACLVVGCNSGGDSNANAGAQTSASGLPVTEERFAAWAKQESVSTERQEAVRDALGVAAKGKASAMEITDAAKREQAVQNWENAVEAMVETRNGDGKELFIEAGLISAEGSDQ